MVKRIVFIAVLIFSFSVFGVKQVYADYVGNEPITNYNHYIEGYRENGTFSREEIESDIIGVFLYDVVVFYNPDDGNEVNSWVSWYLDGKLITTSLNANTYSYELGFSSDILIFASEEAKIKYIGGEKLSNDDIVNIPDGYFLDEDGNLVKIPTLENIGYPLNFRYFLPGMYGQGLSKALLQGNNIHEFQAEWTNADNTLGYKVQIQYKGTYKAKKSWLSSAVEVISDYIDIDEVDMSDMFWSKDEVFVDLGLNAPVYLNISDKLGFSPSLSSLTQIEGIMRVRYVAYDGDYIRAYGNWVSACINGDGNTVAVVDDDGIVIPTDEYGDGEDYTGEDLSDSYWDNLANSKDVITAVISGISALITGIGQVPETLGSLMVWIPSDIWKLISLGIGCMVALGIFKIIRG